MNKPEGTHVHLPAGHVHNAASHVHDALAPDKAPTHQHAETLQYRRVVAPSAS